MPNAPDFGSFFKQYSLLDDYGFSAGILVRLFRQVLPPVPAAESAEYRFLVAGQSADEIVASLRSDVAFRDDVMKQLDDSIRVLGAKVIAYGLDHGIQAKFGRLGLSVEPMLKLSRQLANLKGTDGDHLDTLTEILNDVAQLVTELRKRKSRIGTTFHLTLITRRLLDYTERIVQLVELKSQFESSTCWQTLIDQFVEFRKNQNRLRRHLKRHSDLLALEVVEHTSSKGEKYIADSTRELLRFFFKSLLGGAIIAGFALGKLWLDSWGLGDGSRAMLFGLNYAACFILVTAVGGLIATKQPAMTASTIAEAIDSKNDLSIDSVAAVRKLIFRVLQSQLTSIVGNFVAALSVACLIAIGLDAVRDGAGLEIIDASQLIKKATPSTTLVFFASLAGVFLAVSGLISGYVDNQVMAHNVPERIRRGHGFLRGEPIAKLVHKQAGGWVGNLILGMLLGTAFLLSDVLPMTIDIRHIAFSSANVGFAVAQGDVGIGKILYATCGAVLIGLTNLLVSFSITLLIALKSRRWSVRPGDSVDGP